MKTLLATLLLLGQSLLALPARAADPFPVKPITVIVGVAPGGALDARWWSVTYYDRKGYLVANPANIWSFSGASLTEADKGNWRVAITPDKPDAGHWLPSRKGQPFNLTLRMYNPGEGFRNAPDKAALPSILREACA